MANEEITANAEIIVRRPLEDVFAAFVDPVTMSKFWLRREDTGLRQGETVTWFIGDGLNAPEIEVRVLSMSPPHEMVLEWARDDVFTTITWTLTAEGAEATWLVIEEAGFTGSEDEILARVLDSTGGFNQVIVALKALLEHDAVINVVADHASTAIA